MSRRCEIIVRTIQLKRAMETLGVIYPGQTNFDVRRSRELGGASIG